LRKSQLGYKFTRQYGVGRFVLDFYCSALRLAIELDGSQHMSQENQDYDQKRTDFINLHNIHTIRFYGNDIFNNLEGVVESIIRIINNRKISPPSLPL
jgi:very-short-patch-repair endonuclease